MNEVRARPGVDDVLITDELARRPTRAADYKAESEALARLAGELADRPQTVLQSLTDTVVDMGVADSAGISIEEVHDGKRRFRWDALSGEWAGHKGGTMPYDASPCGVVIDSNRMLLFEHPERVFPDAAVEPLIHEILLVPFHARGKPVGTLWINAHGPERKFDREDARLLKRLAAFASVGYQINRALADSDAKLERELEAARLLQQLSTELLSAQETEAFETRLLGAMRALMRSDAASIQIFQEESGTLLLHAHQGFDEGAAAHWQIVDCSSATSCGAALREGKRMMIGNVEAYPGLQDTLDRETYLRNGLRAVQSTPLIARDGQRLGMISTHWSAPHTPSEEELRSFDVLARQVADLVDRSRAEAKLRESEERQSFLLQLSDTLRRLSDPAAIEGGAARLLGQHLGLSRAYYAQVEADGDHVVIGRDFANAVPSLAGRYRISDFMTSKKDEMLAGRTVTSTDIEGDPDIDERQRGAHRALGVRAFVAVPLIKSGRLAGIFSMIQADPRAWTPAEVSLGEEIAERIWSAVERSRAEERLRESEARFRLIVENARDYAIFTTDAEGRVTGWHAGAQAVFGFPAGEIIGRGAEILFTPGDRARGDVEKELAQARDRGSAPNVRWHVRKDGERVFIEGRTIALRDSGGGLSGYLKIGQDLTERRRADAALRESEARFREFGENSGDVLWIVDAETRQLEYLSPAFERIWGEARDRVRGGLEQWATTLHPEDRERALAGMPKLLAGERFEQEYRVVRPDGELRWIRDSGFPIFDAEGKVSRVAGIAQDFTELRAISEAVRKSEIRFRTLSEGIPQMVWRAADYGAWNWASPQWTAFTGQSNEDSWGWGWLDPVHPEDRAAAKAAWERARKTDVFDIEYRVRHAASDRYRWFQTRATPVRDSGGELVEWLGTSTDIEDLRSLQGHQATLLAELQHRVRNTLAVLRSIARRTAENSNSVEEMASHLQGRIGAFSRVQSAITREPGRGVLLAGLIAEELVVHALDEGERLSISGPPVCLATRPAESISLMIHELATNAVKYGALSAEHGRIAVGWAKEQRDGADWLRFRWVERGLDDPLAPPSRRGFGLELFERSLAYDLSAEVEVRFRPEGLEFEMAVPAERVEAS